VPEVVGGVEVVAPGLVHEGADEGEGGIVGDGDVQQGAAVGVAHGDVECPELEARSEEIAGGGLLPCCLGVGVVCVCGGGGGGGGC
jgi:hypothetical protein